MKKGSVFIVSLFLLSCTQNKDPVTYYPTAGEIYAGEKGRLVMPDDERVPVLLGRSVHAFKDGWAAYVAGREDLNRALRNRHLIRWVPSQTEVRVIMTNTRLGVPFVFIRLKTDHATPGGLLEQPTGWWTDAKNFQITVMPQSSRADNQSFHKTGGVP